MKAILCPRYGSPDVLRLCEVMKPTPQEDEVLIQIHAASLNSRDLRMLRANPFFMRLMPGCLFKPKNKILGADLAGRVVDIGCNVKQFKLEDEVFGFLPSSTGRGTLAEFVSAKENLIALKPSNLTFAQAAAVPLAAMTALQGLRDVGNIQPGQKVLIQGASGGVGTFALQIAKAFETEVTAVCSMRNQEMALSLGADHVIDYEVEDFTQSGIQYDLILAVNGFHPLENYLRALKPSGSYVVAGGGMHQILQARISAKRNSPKRTQKIGILSMKQNKNDLILIKELLEAGDIKPVIDGCYPLNKAPEAFRYFEEEHSQGKIVITVEHNIRWREEK